MLLLSLWYTIHNTQYFSWKGTSLSFALKTFFVLSLKWKRLFLYSVSIRIVFLIHISLHFHSTLFFLSLFWYNVDAANRIYENISIKKCNKEAITIWCMAKVRVTFNSEDWQPRKLMSDGFSNREEWDFPLYCRLQGFCNFYIVQSRIV